MKRNISKPLYILAMCFYSNSCIATSLASKSVAYWLQDSGYSLTSSVFYSAVLSYPYSFRIFFTPWLEYVKVPMIKGWGHDKNLLLYINMINIMLVVIMSMVGLQHFSIFFTVAFICSVLSTAQETLSTSYFINSYEDIIKQSWVMGGQVGYNIAVFFTTTLYIYLSQFVSWNTLYAISALVMLCNSSALLFANNSIVTRSSAPSAAKLYVEPMKSFYSRHEHHFASLQMFLLFYRAPDKTIASVLSLLMIKLYGKNGATILKIMSLCMVLVGTYVLTFFDASNPIRRLLAVSKLHMSMILTSSGILASYYYTKSSTLLYTFAIAFLMLKVIRTCESMAIFEYQCSLFDKRNFNAESSIGNLSDKGFGSILSSISGLFATVFGPAAFLASTTILVIPAYIVSRKLIKTSD